jgi:hypothetical protein
MAELKKKSHYISSAQTNKLIELLQNEPDLLSGKFISKFTYKEGQKKWEEIAQIVNSIPGARKDWKQWRKVSIKIDKKKESILWYIYVKIAVLARHSH